MSFWGKALLSSVVEKTGRVDTHNYAARGLTGTASMVPVCRCNVSLLQKSVKQQLLLETFLELWQKTWPLISKGDRQDFTVSSFPSISITEFQQAPSEEVSQVWLMHSWHTHFRPGGGVGGDGRGEQMRGGGGFISYIKRFVY